MRFVISVAMGLVLLVFGSSAQTDEHKIPLSEVPKAAIDAVKARFPGADLKGAGKQGQRPLKRCSDKDFQQKVFVPTTTAAFHRDAGAIGMLLQK